MKVAELSGFLGGQSYYLHTQDRRVFSEKAPYNFFEDVPKGHEKVNAFRRWIHEELMGGKRAQGPTSMPTKLVPTDQLVREPREAQSAVLDRGLGAGHRRALGPQLRR